MRISLFYRRRDKFATDRSRAVVCNGNRVRSRVVSDRARCRPQREICFGCKVRGLVTKRRFRRRDLLRYYVPEFNFVYYHIEVVVNAAPIARYGKRKRIRSVRLSDVGKRHVERLHRSDRGRTSVVKSAVCAGNHKPRLSAFACGSERNAHRIVARLCGFGDKVGIKGSLAAVCSLGKFHAIFVNGNVCRAVPQRKQTFDSRVIRRGIGKFILYAVYNVFDRVREYNRFDAHKVRAHPPAARRNP